MIFTAFYANKKRPYAEKNRIEPNVFKTVVMK